MVRRIMACLAVLAAAPPVCYFVARAAEPSKAPRVESAAPIAESAADDKLPVIGLGELSEVDKALGKPVALKFASTELKDVAATIAKQFGINVVLNRRALAEADIRENLRITCDLPQAPLGQALGLLLGRYDLGYTTADNVLTITTAEAARVRLIVRFYNVRELAMPLGDFDQPGDDWRVLIGVIEATVAPQTWEDNGGAGSLRCQNGILVVDQYEEAQEEITDLLTMLVRLRRASRGSIDPERLTYLQRSPLWKKLEAVQDVHFEGGSLRDLVAWLRRHDLPADLDAKGLDESNLADVKLSALDAHHVTLQWALRHILGEKDADFVIDHEMVLITSDEHEKTAVVTFLYPVGDLVDAAAEDSGMDGDAAFDQLMKTIRSTVAPQTWDDAGGAGGLMRFTPSRLLICCQTQAIQPQVEQLLSQLRAAYKATRGAAAEGTAAKPIVVLKSYELAAETEKARGAREPSPGEQYAALIRTVIEPKSWTDGTALVSVVPGALVVRATPVVQTRVRRLLEHVGALKAAAQTKPPVGGSASTGIPMPPTASPPAAPETPK